MATADQASLFRGAQEGSREAFEGLIDGLRDQLGARIRSRIQPRLRRDLEPEDVLQETLLFSSSIAEKPDLPDARASMNSALFSSRPLEWP